ncbi:hypothetical protein PM3016_6850 [Paenibacillus mucilaginosus 3016]|uniref:Uncharacterized protein n=1 Tax=Paenibacillus mucilaginosus 3016 TaxID=1116391 RepID=H6NPU4_9BACL|nr:hypothetical protein [Paenibacillus mucilaginosus]AFC33450.1 hypothetical protein PM3016_6850 [Paenibacillus mucilaginosus 3016]WFA21861.1 hypothetical protein ERY13_34015 [Paenibacillus mucilaginosus]
MKRWSMALVISTVALGWTGTAWVAGPQEPAAESYSAPAVQTAAAEPLSAGPGTASPASAVSGAEEEAAWTEAVPEWELQRVNGLSMSDDLKTLYEIKGEPLAVEKDPLFKDEQIFVYEDCRVGLYQNFIQYILVPAAAGTIDIDGVRLELTADALRQALGEPDWKAEDGVVYQRGQAALKLFLSPENGSLTSVQYFHDFQS